MSISHRRLVRTLHLFNLRLPTGNVEWGFKSTRCTRTGGAPSRVPPRRRWRVQPDGYGLVPVYSETAVTWLSRSWVNVPPDAPPSVRTRRGLPSLPVIKRLQISKLRERRSVPSEAAETSWTENLIDPSPSFASESGSGYRQALLASCKIVRRKTRVRVRVRDTWTWTWTHFAV